MKLVTWNVNSLKVRMPRVLELLERHAPDVVLLQETKTEGAAFPEAELRIASVYVPNGRELGSEPFAQKLAFLEAMAARAPALDVIAGDMNVCPTDADVYDPAAFVGETHVTPEERSRLAAVLSSGGLVDAYRRLHPEPEPGFTWWDYRAGNFHKGLGLRIDLVLMREELAAGLRSCGIDRDFRKGFKPSDHAPLLVETD